MSRKMNDLLDELCQREDNYVHMNDALEAKSCALEQEAEQMMKLQRENLFTGPCDESLSTDLNPFEDYPGTRPVQNSRQNESKLSNEKKADASDYRSTDTLLDLSPDIGSEAMVRLLKTKLRVLQEEAEKLAEDTRRLTLENSSLTSNVRNLEDTNSRLQRATVSHQQTADKMKQQLEAATSHGAQFEIECSALRKEVDTIKKSQKQCVSSQNMTEVRLNRALEQSEKYRLQLQKTQQSKKDIYSQEQKKVDELLVENRRLQKQKNDLMVAFKKQMKLIDILKRQKMHLEASKVLEFTEAEFLKAIDWKD